MTTSKMGAPSPARGVRQVLRTTDESFYSRVVKLCAGVPSSTLRVVALRSALAERLAGATGSRVTLSWILVSANNSSRQTSRRCHWT